MENATEAFDSALLQKAMLRLFLCIFYVIAFLLKVSDTDENALEMIYHE